MIKHRSRGGRMQHYYPTPVRYRLSSTHEDDHGWHAQLIGVFFLASGVVWLAMPLIKSLGPGTQLFFSIFGLPQFVGGRGFAVGDAMWGSLVVGVLLALVGAGVLARYAPAFLAAMGIAFVLFMPAFPVGTAAGVLMLYVLWQGMPAVRDRADREA